MKRIISAITIVILTFHLSACASGTLNASEATETVNTGEIYSFETIGLPESNVSIVEAIKCGNNIIMYGVKKDNANRFFLLDVTSVQLTSINCNLNYVENIAEIDEEHFAAISIGPDGEYILSTIKTNGEVESSFALDPSLLEDDIVVDFLAMSSGYVIQTTKCLLCLSKSGGLIKCIDDYGGGINIVKANPEKILFIYSVNAPEKNHHVIEISNDFSTSNSVQFDKRYNAYFPAEGDALFANTGDTLYLIDYKNAKTAGIIDIFLSQLFPSSFIQIDKEKFFSIQNGCPTIWKPEVKGQTIVLTLYTYRLDPSVEAAIRSFNSQSSQYKVDVIDYSQFDLEENDLTGLIKMNTDIISGNQPDIYDLSNFSTELFANRGLLYDLNPYFENDEDVSIGDILPNVFECQQYKGAIYDIIPAFSIVTACSDQSIVGLSKDWSINHFLDISEEYSAEQLFGEDSTREAFLGYVLIFLKNELIDTENAKCYFDSDLFIKLLEYSANLVPEDNLGETSSQSIARAYAGEQKILIVNLSEGIFKQVSVLETIFPNGLEFVGFPSNSELNSALLPVARFGMSSACKNPNAAWTFFKFLLSKENKMRGFPVIKEDLRKYIDDAFFEDQGKKNTLTSFYSGGTLTIEGQVISEQTKAVVESLVFNPSCIAEYDTHIYNIIIESAKAYYAGDRTVDETAEIIQSKISLYLAEQYG